MKRMVAVVVVLVALAGFGVYLLRRGYSAVEEPSALEEAVARRLRHLATPAQARERRNPVAATPEVMAEALAHFADHCAMCHANDGSGETPLGRGMYPKAPDMRKASTQDLSDGELYYIIRNGVRFTGMPGWGGPAEQEDRDSWGLVHFVRRLPSLGTDELMEMRRLNPKGPEDLAMEQEAEAFLRGDAPAPPGGGHNH
jgi:mono/diheme cytochrome c family protein